MHADYPLYVGFPNIILNYQIVLVYLHCQKDRATHVPDKEKMHLQPI